MASLILTAVGTAIGGPIGGLIGTLVGSQVDRLVLGGAGRREGPRLKDLGVQLASYGEPAPLVYGRARLAGTLIWSSGLLESRSKQKVGGKGGGSVTTYTYSVSVAVALSGRPIIDVGRIWADGKLIRSGPGAALAPGGSLRLYTGSENQLPDPLIEAAVGMAQAPAHRGLAYAVIEGLPLADFANRAPNLTFEVIADGSATVDTATIAGDLLQRARIASGATGAIPGAIRGYAFARPQSARSALEALGVAAPFQAFERDGLLRVEPYPATPALALPSGWLGASEEGGQSQARRDEQRQQDVEVPADLSLLFWDEARDYQTNVQRARASGKTGPATLIEAPVVLSPDAARTAAEAFLDRQSAARWRRTVRLPLAALALAPGDAVTMADRPGDLWLIEEMALDRGAIEAVLVFQPGATAAVTAAPQPPIGQNLVPAGPTSLQLLDLPLLPGRPDAPQLHAAAAGASAGWRRASLFLSLDGGSSYAGVAEFSGAATIGTARTIAGVACAGLWDLRTSIDIELLRGDMTLESVPLATVLAGGNLCRIGSELLQFADATLLPDGRYRLSRLLRGRFGTEEAISSHTADEPFVLIDFDDLARIDMRTQDIGLSAQFKALTPQQSLGDVAPIALTFSARALRPLAPVHLSAERAGSGDWQIRWVRRSRSGYDWVDGADAPLAEDELAFDLIVLSGAVAVRTMRVATPEATVTAAHQLADFGALQSTLTVEVMQISARAGRGLAARRTFTA